VCGSRRRTRQAPAGAFQREDLHDDLADHEAEDVYARRMTRRGDMMSLMPAIPESTRTSLAQRLRAHATANWPQLTTVYVRYRGQFAYVDGELAGGDRLPLMRLRYGGSAHRWGTAIYVASTDSYQNQIWLTRTIEEVFDLVCDLHVA
jgi:hypothetical protein